MVLDEKSLQWEVVAVNAGVCQSSIVGFAIH